jgi:hypothetical protein
MEVLARSTSKMGSSTSSSLKSTAFSSLPQLMPRAVILPGWSPERRALGQVRTASYGGIAAVNSSSAPVRVSFQRVRGWLRRCWRRRGPPQGRTPTAQPARTGRSPSAAGSRSGCPAALPPQAYSTSRHGRAGGRAGRPCRWQPKRRGEGSRAEGSRAEGAQNGAAGDRGPRRGRRIWMTHCCSDPVMGPRGLRWARAGRPAGPGTCRRRRR